MNAVKKFIKEQITAFLRSEGAEGLLSRVGFEGPYVVIYVKDPQVLLEKKDIVARLARHIRKRIIMRIDPEKRLDPEEAKKEIKEIVPDFVGFKGADFDPVTGEVIIEVERDLILKGNQEFNTEVIRRTGWVPRIARFPTIKSSTVEGIRRKYIEGSKQRRRSLERISEKIFRPILSTGDVRILALGGFREVGRSAILVRTKESCVLLDCGIKPGTRDPTEAYPRFDIPEFDIEEIDAVIISHAHIDHCGFVPFLYKYGYRGPVYCSEPTLHLMAMLQEDLIDVAAQAGVIPPYDRKDIEKELMYAVPLRYKRVTDITPDIKLDLQNAGHILGSCIVHLHIGDGLYNIIYTGDMKYGKTALLGPAYYRFPRAETLIIESTYGAPEDLMKRREETEAEFANLISHVIERGGKVLIPVPAVGRAQEIMFVLDRMLRAGKIPLVPVYIEGMIWEATGIYTSYFDHLAPSVRDDIEAENPFREDSEFFTPIRDPMRREEVIMEKKPCIVLATSGMLEGGPVLEYLKELAPKEENALIFVSYQIEGTLGRRILDGLRELEFREKEGIRRVQLKMQVFNVTGFSGHSDRIQLVNYVKRLKGAVQGSLKKVIVCHGEEKKAKSLARHLARVCEVEATAPHVLDMIRLY